MVEWDGAWYFARIIDDEGDTVYISYPFYDSSWDEWVTADRFAEE